MGVVTAVDTVADAIATAVVIASNASHRGKTQKWGTGE
jgi:hypothetical protein